MADRSPASSATASSSSEDEHQHPSAPQGLEEDTLMLEDMDEDMAVCSANLRTSLKIIRDPSKTAFDMLPSGETLGAFANRHAIDRYARKVESKRERARETRMKKRKLVKSIQRRKEKAIPVYGHISGSCIPSQITNGVGTHGLQH